MHIQLKLSGYRCFAPDKPACIVLREGLIALVGLNNTGKSAFLRSIYELRSIFQKLHSNDNQFRASLLDKAEYEPAATLGDYRDLFWHFSDDDASIEISLPEFETAPSTFWKATLRLFRGDEPKFSLILHDFKGIPISGPVEIKPAIYLSDEDSKSKRSWLLVNGIHGDHRQLLRAFDLLSRCFYCPSIRHATAFAPDSNVRTLYDIKIGKPFIEDWQHHQQGEGKLATETIEKIIRDIQRLFRYERLQIQASTGARDMLVVANEKSLRLSDLGSGLSQFIVLLGNIAFREPTWILVDEPELNLHPALQLDFLQAVAARATEGVVFATHSLGLARQAGERIYTFSQTAGQTSVNPIESTNNLAEIIGEMSFGRVDFSARKILLVEGQLDVLTFETLLSMVNKEHEFAILALGGKSGINGRRLKELQHVTALNLRVFSIIDSEKCSAHSAIESHRKEFKAICHRLEIDCHILKRRAIENYFSERAIRTALGKPHYRELLPYESLASIPHHWRKHDNWKIARAMLWDEIARTDLGQWLSKLT